jgi:hypothetical protein
LRFLWLLMAAHIHLLLANSAGIFAKSGAASWTNGFTGSSYKLAPAVGFEPASLFRQRVIAFREDIAPKWEQETPSRDSPVVDNF